MTAADETGPLRHPDGTRTPRLGSLVPGKLVDRGRAALAGVEAARANVEAMGASIRDDRRGPRRPHAPLGPSAVELTSIGAQAATRSLTIGELDDDDASLTWPAVLSWWGGGLV